MRQMVTDITSCLSMLQASIYQCVVSQTVDAVVHNTARTQDEVSHQIRARSIRLRQVMTVSICPHFVDIHWKQLPLPAYLPHFSCITKTRRSPSQQPASPVCSLQHCRLSVHSKVWCNRDEAEGETGAHMKDASTATESDALHILSRSPSRSMECAPCKLRIRNHRFGCLRPAVIHISKIWTNLIRGLL